MKGKSYLRMLMSRDSLTEKIKRTTPVVYCKSILRAYMRGAKANSFPIREHGLFGGRKKT